MRIAMDRAAYLQGENASFSLETEGTDHLNNLQIEIYRIGIKNPSSQLGYGKTAQRSEDGIYRDAFPTTHFPFGLYEIKLVRFHSGGESSNNEIDFVSQRDFERVIFEIVPPFATMKSEEQLAEKIEELEAQIEEDFLAPRYAPGVQREIANEFAVFVFISKLLIGRPYRLDRFELVPAPVSVSHAGETAAVNAFLAQRTDTRVTFTSGADEQTQSQQDNPVCVAYFPTVIANIKEEARAYCSSQADTALLSLGLMRGSSGRIFASVVIPLEAGEPTLFSSRTSYSGNLLTGGLAGELPSVLEKYQTLIERDPTARLWADLYREAQKEEHPDFQYFKYWQVLEVMAEDLDTPQTDEFKDEKGNLIEDTENLKSDGSAVKVFRLLRNSKFGTTREAWENANKWFALRTAVGHFGTTSKFEQLSRDKVKAWARKALEEEKNAKFPKVLANLQSAVEHLLRLQLIGRS